MCRVTRRQNSQVKDPAFEEKPVERKNASGLYKMAHMRSPEIWFWEDYDWSET